MSKLIFIFLILISSSWSDLNFIRASPQSTEPLIKQVSPPKVNLFSNTENQYQKNQQTILYIKCNYIRPKMKDKIECDLNFVSFVKSSFLAKKKKNSHRVLFHNETNVFSLFENKSWIWKAKNFGICKTDIVVKLTPSIDANSVLSWNMEQDFTSVKNKDSKMCDQLRQSIGNPMIYKQLPRDEFELNNETGLFF